MLRPIYYLAKLDVIILLLIDCDLRKGRQYAIFGVYPTPGLSNYLSGIDVSGNESSDNVFDYIQETEVNNLSVLPAGDVPPNPSELLITERMENCLKKLKEKYDMILLDATPSSLVTDAVIISRYVDTTIIVASHKSTKMEDLKNIKREIQNVGGKIAGVVINKVPTNAKKYTNHYYYYGEHNAESSGERRRNRRGVLPDSANLKSKAEEIIKQNRYELEKEDNGETIENESNSEDNLDTNIEQTQISENYQENITDNTSGDIANDTIDTSYSSYGRTEDIIKQIKDYINTEKENMNNTNNNDGDNYNTNENNNNDNNNWENNNNGNEWNNNNNNNWDNNGGYYG